MPAWAIGQRAQDFRSGSTAIFHRTRPVPCPAVLLPPSGRSIFSRQLRQKGTQLGDRVSGRSVSKHSTAIRPWLLGSSCQQPEYPQILNLRIACGLIRDVVPGAPPQDLVFCWGSFVGSYHVPVPRCIAGIRVHVRLNELPNIFCRLQLLCIQKGAHCHVSIIRSKFYRTSNFKLSKHKTN